MNLQKHKNSDLSGLGAENQRTGHRYSNPDIDTTRSHLNYNLAEELHDKGIKEFVMTRSSNIKGGTRKNGVTWATWVVTVPREPLDEPHHNRMLSLAKNESKLSSEEQSELFKLRKMSNAQPLTLTEEQQERFFEKSYEFLKNRYGSENVVSAHVHLDETTPHMHFNFTPVVKDENGVEKFNARQLINRNELRMAQVDLDKQILKEFNLEYGQGILNGKTAGGSRTVEEMKADGLKIRNNELETKIELNHQKHEDWKTQTLASMKSMQSEHKQIKAHLEIMREQKEKSDEWFEETKKVETQFYNKVKQLESHVENLVEDRKKIDIQFNENVKEFNVFVNDYLDYGKELDTLPKFKELKTDMIDLAETVSKTPWFEKKSQIFKDVVTEFKESKSFVQTLKFAFNAVLPNFTQFFKPRL